MIAFEPLLVFKVREHMLWLKEHVRCVVCEDTQGIVARRDGKIVAMFVFDSWSPNSVQCHQAVLDPMVFKHGFHKHAANYVFNHAGRSLMIGLTPSDNEAAIRLNEHYGFREAWRVPDGYDKGVDYIVYMMHRDECPYLEQAA